MNLHFCRESFPWFASRFFALALYPISAAAWNSGPVSIEISPQSQPILRFAPVPATDEYQFSWSPDLRLPFTPSIPGTRDGFVWTGSQAIGGHDGQVTAGFYRLEAKLLPVEKVVAFNLLNRIAYGPTPDELERVLQIGPDAFIEEQLAAEKIVDDVDTPPKPEVTADGWTKVTTTGLATTSNLYIYLSDTGDAYLDDMRLVAGQTDNGTAVNLIKNGGFESALGGTWTLGTFVTNSARSTVAARSGTSSLHLFDSGPGVADKTSGTILRQAITPSMTVGNYYTLSFWYKKEPDQPTPVARFSGGANSPDDPKGISTFNARSAGDLRARLDASTASRGVLQGWHVQRAVQSPRQLNEILRQFCENHFVTEYSKGADYLDGKLPNEVVPPPATRLEYQENLRWANALLKPDVTFLDLLKISAESPAMIIYLDTVNSVGAVDNRGVVTKIANENYARELLELFCFGVDNGYDQQDIVQISRAWTGWSVELTAPGQEFNPLAAKSTVYKNPGATNNRSAYTNLQGQWSFKYKSANHYTGPKYIFAQQDDKGVLLPNTPKVVPDRFGAPWAGKPYQLTLPARSGNAGLQDGYDVLNHMANQPFTSEFLSVKLCQVFVHDDFHLGYDFTDDITTPEEDLVHQMMLTWENPPQGGPKGQLRPVLRVLFNSSLFRSSLSSASKVKTPLEYAVSTIRALRAKRRDGGYTASTDGSFLASSSGVIRRAGNMDLFNRAEPDGYAESAAPWISAGTLAERLRFIQAALIAPGQTGHADAGDLTVTDPVELLRVKGIPTNDSAAVADYFLSLLFPTEGRANLDGYRKLAIQFLDTSNNGRLNSPLSSLNAADADVRIRGMVAFLMTTPRFQEQ